MNFSMKIRREVSHMLTAAQGPDWLQENGRRGMGRVADVAWGRLARRAVRGAKHEPPATARSSNIARVVLPAAALERVALGR